MIEPFMQFGLIILIVLFVSLIIRLLKQPLIIGYIISGIIVGPVVLNLIRGSETITLFSELGIAFLLFIVGLHLSPKVIKEVGKISLITGIGQILFTAIIGFSIAYLLNFPILTSLYIAIGLTFSSTIIIMKLLSDKDALEKLYGKISVGFLLVQDLIAVLILIIISSITSNEGSNAGGLFLLIIAKGIILATIFGLISHFLLPKLERFLAKSQEFLFLFSIAWGFGLALIFSEIGFSIEVGALIAGVLLSLAPYNHEISAKLKPLRDFFLIFFFVILGSQMIFGNIKQLILPVIIFSALIIFGNPLIIIFLMGRMRYSKKTSFMAGLTVAQIGEFSLIFIALGVKVGHISPEILSFITLISLMTIFGCTYLIRYSEKLYEKLSKPLSLFERKKIKDTEIPKKEYDYILLGYNRIGFSIIKSFAKITKKFLIIDYDPDVVKKLKNKKLNAIYGDVDDSELIEDLGIAKAKVIVSTIPDKDTNTLILDIIKRNKSKTITILTGRQIQDALDLYKAGANYVIMPHFLGGEYVSKLIEKYKSNPSMYEKEKKKELITLKERLTEGHEHPRTEKERK
ncbi:cation:proton antiporter [Candidatus Woesearchaeota archaeon]|nr:cation:proton antiporter [Candidatus Woesearchaeota archaeon]